MTNHESAWLSDDEVVEFTGYRWRAKQQLALAEMGVPFHVNPRGRILVLRIDVGMKRDATRRKPEANWDAIRPAARKQQ